MKYKTAKALEQAVKAAANKSERDTNRAIASFYHDRLLCRIFSQQTPSFILKGGQSMLAKIPDARETRDIDLLSRSTDLDEALEALKQAAQIDLDDFIEFRFDKAVPTDTSQDYRKGYTVTFETWLGGTKQVGLVSIDLVVDPTPPEEFEILKPAARLPIDDIAVFDYLTNTAETRVAEKICATMQTYVTGPSSRVKDLADLVKSMLNEQVNANILARRIKTECAFRHMDDIVEFCIPPLWKTTLASNYQKVARQARLPHEFEEAITAEMSIAAWIGPVLSGKAQGCTWNPEEQAWE